MERLHEMEWSRLQNHYNLYRHGIGDDGENAFIFMQLHNIGYIMYTYCGICIKLFVSYSFVWHCIIVVCCWLVILLCEFNVSSRRWKYYRITWWWVTVTWSILVFPSWILVKGNWKALKLTKRVSWMFLTIMVHTINTSYWNCTYSLINGGIVSAKKAKHYS